MQNHRTAYGCNLGKRKSLPSGSGRKSVSLRGSLFGYSSAILYEDCRQSNVIGPRPYRSSLTFLDNRGDDVFETIHYMEPGSRWLSCNRQVERREEYRYF